ncbi:hypothetical protein [Serratia sp. UGAL515B_01]|uniref:hypothetical protein n=1 Tax=Serratia sp. UGAL515B_01 TaxID=2986763 RepID=UPI002952D282|nr:hypothetical protein [Serratia sp. UGAL515B_01]WON76492.1 hypothetical protein OK023_14940 [Serratia sp. UGAL515B_01]
MRKSLKVLFGVVIVVVAALLYAWPYVEMELAGFANYTEQDKREYEFYTPDILKKMPRITENYDFDFANITGPAKHVNAVKFYGTDNTSKIDAYLTAIGYKKQDECDLNSSCWRASDPNETIYVGILTGEKTVIVQVVYDFTHNVSRAN